MSRAAIENLREHQDQLDADGCRVGVSRQALDEVLARVAELEALVERQIDYREGLEKAIHQIAREAVSRQDPQWCEDIAEAALQQGGEQDG